MFENFKVFETEFAGRPLKVEVGKMAMLANGACLVRYGETEVLCTATMAEKPREGVDFFPLSVDFEEKMYSVGRIPGSFQRREGRPSESAILISRVIDRPIRPLFPKDMRNDVSVVATVMSVDPDCQPQIAAQIGVSVALSISEIPWDGPVSSVILGYVDGKFVVNPSLEDREKTEMMVTVSSTDSKIAMLEACANEIPDDVMYDGIMFAHEENKKIVDFIKSIQSEIGKEKLPFESSDPSEELFEAIKEFAIEDVKKALDTDDKTVRDEALLPIYDAVHEKFDEEFADEADKIDDCMDKLQKLIVRRWLLDEGKRVDGRKIDEIRPLNAQIDLLSRTHGSAMFTRGQTQVLTTVTLGGKRDAQLLDGIDENTEKLYMHQYNFPSYSVGETRPSRGPGRREIGHGALAEKALLPVIPKIEDFPYVMRLVSEVLSSNGSTSQASVCASSLALMAAGVPIKSAVAGISCGLVTEGDRFLTMTDIQGLEDFYGDMDFKVAGSKNGITAIQIDTKIHGLTPEIVKEAFEKTKKARAYILDEVMNPVIDKAREELSKYAPKMLTMTVDPDKIGDIIGKQGKNIQKISEQCNCAIDIEEDGKIFISSESLDDANRAVEIIKTIVSDPEIGAIYKGIVTKIMNFGAFVEIAPGKEGLCHISQLDVNRTEKVEDVVSVGDEIIVKVVDITPEGKIDLSRKAAIIKVEGLDIEDDSNKKKRPKKPFNSHRPRNYEY
ncbi:MAG: polyribonucleotide nucleotidyltransferase [Clostridia bacterium]|nr:polyribonucleotide nucleotidyltransferase [Clostridia bacterium]